MSQNHYSTIDLPGARSIDAWRQAMAEVYYRLDIQSRHDDRLNGELLDVQFHSLGISNFKADAQRVIRRKEAAKADKAENFVFLFPTRKEMQFEQRGRTGLVAPGDVFLLNSAEDYIVDVPDGSENITIKIDRSILIDRVKDIDSLCGATNIATPHLVPVVATLGSQLLKLRPGENAERLQQSVVDLICLMLDLRDAQQGPSLVRETLATSIFNRLDGYIRENLQRVDLSPDHAAMDHRISVRYLHKIFHHHGTSFGQRLLEIRLQHAHQLISSRPAMPHVNIGEVAFQCGFSNQSYFSACYRKRFGLTPRQTERHDGHAASKRPESLSDPRSH